jgi:uncharacterized membrane protein
MNSGISQVHVIAAVAALLLAGIVFPMRKGTWLHVRVGCGYVVRYW